MSDRTTLQIVQISGHPGPVPGKGVQRQDQVCKLVDTTTCIGCKACEVACVEWNDMPFQQTYFENTYQTMPETNWNYWNLMPIPDVCARVRQTVRSFSIRTASLISSRRIASDVSIALLDVLSIFLASIRRRRRCTSARFVLTECPRGWNPHASKLARQAACTLAPKMT